MILDEIKEYHKSQLKALTFVLSAANNSKLQSRGTVKLTLYPDVTDHRFHQNTIFTLTFDVSDIDFNILGTPFLEKYVESIKCLSHTLEIKHNYETNFQSSTTKSPPHNFQLFPVIGDHTLFFYSLLNIES